MIAAANIDGCIDTQEQQQIVAGAERAGMGPAERQVLTAELGAPHAPYGLLGQVHDHEMAKQFYLVTLLAIDRDSEVEQVYVRALPLILRIPNDEVAQIHQQLGIA